MTYAVDEVALREPNLLVPRKKPVGQAKIDWSNPFAQGLTTCIIPMNGQMIDVVDSTFPATDGSTTRGGVNGASREYDSTNKTEFTVIDKYHINGVYTFVIIFDADTLTNYGHLVACQVTSTTQGWELRIGHTPTESNVLFSIASNSNYAQYSTGSTNRITAGSKHNFVALHNNSRFINASPHFHVNGVNYTATIERAGTAQQVTDSTDNLHFGLRYDSATKLDGSIHMFAMWNDRELSDGQLAELYRDPYQLLIPA